MRCTISAWRCRRLRHQGAKRRVPTHQGLLHAKSTTTMKTITIKPVCYPSRKVMEKMASRIMVGLLEVLRSQPVHRKSRGVSRRYLTATKSLKTFNRRQKIRHLVAQSLYHMRIEISSLRMLNSDERLTATNPVSAATLCFRMTGRQC